jgi:hypothetical protein
MFDTQTALSKKERTITIPSSSIDEGFDGSLAVPFYNRSIDIWCKVNTPAWLLRDLIKILCNIIEG